MSNKQGMTRGNPKYPIILGIAFKNCNDKKKTWKGEIIK